MIKSKKKAFWNRTGKIEDKGFLQFCFSVEAASVHKKPPIILENGLFGKSHYWLFHLCRVNPIALIYLYNSFNKICWCYNCKILKVYNRLTHNAHLWSNWSKSIILLHMKSKRLFNFLVNHSSGITYTVYFFGGGTVKNIVYWTKL